jgi:hypothetical protein
MFIYTPVQHVGLRIPCLPHICRRNLDLVEIIVSIMVALRPSFVKAVQFCSVHLHFILVTIRS